MDQLTGTRLRSRFVSLTLATVSLGLTLAVAGCRSDPPTVTPVPPTEDPFSRITPSPEARAISIEIKTSVIVPGFDRLAFVLKRDDGEVIENGNVETTFYRQSDSGPQRTANGPALFFGRGLTGGGRWVTYTDFDASGPWSVDVAVQLMDGTQGIARADFQVAGRTKLPAARQPPPTGETPYAEDASGVAALTTDPNPANDLYYKRVSSGVVSGYATVVHFSSPGNCPEAECRDALDPIKRAATAWKLGANFIHIESRDPADPSQMSATAKDWGLTTDPWTFIFDTQGFLSARVEGPLGVDELNLLTRRASGMDESTNAP